MGYNKNVVILTRPADYRKKTGKWHLERMFYKKYPRFAKRLENRALEYNRMIEDIRSLEREGRIYVIRPETPLEIGRLSHDPPENQPCLRTGTGRRTGPFGANAFLAGKLKGKHAIRFFRWRAYAV